MAKSKALVNVDAELAKEVGAIQQSIGSVSGNRIRIPQGKKLFKTPDGGEGDTLSVVILDFASVNMYYDGPYNPNNIQPPACFAIGDAASHGGKKNDNLTPSANAPEVQATDCGTCAWNQFKSDARGTGKACKNTKLVAVMSADDDPEEGAIAILSVSPTSLKNFDGYIAKVSNSASMNPIKLVTTVSFSETSEWAQLVFDPASPNERYTEHFNRREEARMMLAQEPDTSNRVSSGKKPAVRKTGSAVATKKKAAAKRR